MLNIFYLAALIFLVLSLVANISNNFPHFPWDIYFDKWGISLYLPVISSIIISVVLSLLFKHVGV